MIRYIVDHRLVDRLIRKFTIRGLFSIGSPFLIAGLALMIARSEIPLRDFSKEALAYSDIVRKVKRQLGVSLVAGRSIDESAFEALLASNANWIVQTPFGWQQHYDSPKVMLARDGRILWGEKDKGIIETTRLARVYGLKTMLKPHIWLRNRSDDKWRSDIAMTSAEDWRLWFESYTTFILHYAQLAEELGIEALCIGTELQATVVAHPDEWSRIIDDIRNVYSGKLTYAANWYQEFEQVEFWDKLDYIGVQAYFPLTNQENPDHDELIQGWRPHIKSIERIHSKYDKPVIFTEVGYRSMTDAAIEPWKWPQRRSEAASDLDLKTQAVCYQALFETFWHKPWFAGCYIWKWFPNPERRAGSRSKGFTPQNKPAQAVLAQWYGSQEPEENKD